MRVRALNGTNSEAIYTPELPMRSGRSPSSPLALSCFSYSLTVSPESRPRLSTCPRLTISGSVSRESTAALYDSKDRKANLPQGTQRPVRQNQRQRKGYHSEYKGSDGKTCRVHSGSAQGWERGVSDSLSLNLASTFTHYVTQVLC